MKNLFLIYIGGSHTGALVELHDIRLVIAEKIEDTYPALKASWWGEPESLHLDAWGVLQWADGYRIELSDTPQVNEGAKLYFVNLGGYDPSQFTELHRNLFVVAENEKEAKARALTYITDWKLPHRDYQYEIDKILNVNNLLADYHLKLIPWPVAIPFTFECNYIPIGKKGSV